MKNVFIFIVLIILSSCSQSTDNGKEIRKENDNGTNEIADTRCDTLASENVYDIKNYILNITDDDEIFKKDFINTWSINTEAVENRHTPGQMDTIYTFRKNNSEVKIYKVNSGKSILYKFNLNESDYNKLNEITRNDVISRLKSNSLSCNIITIESPEVPSFLTLKFKGENLEEVNFDGYLD